MKFTLYLNGSEFDAEIRNPKDLEKLRALAIPEDLNQKDAAAYCGVSAPTFRSWKIKKNANNRYPVSALQKRKES